MNKNELISQVAQSANLSKTAAGQAVDAVFKAIEQSLVKKDDVRLIGFGTFSVIQRKESVGRNPRTGEEITIPASQQPKFKPGQKLKDLLNPSPKVTKASPASSKKKR